jgi:hypothetical protein
VAEWHNSAQKTRHASCLVRAHGGQNSDSNVGDDSTGSAPVVYLVSGLCGRTRLFGNLTVGPRVWAERRDCIRAGRRGCIPTGQLRGYGWQCRLCMPGGCRSLGRGHTSGRPHLPSGLLAKQRSGLRSSSPWSGAPNELLSDWRWPVLSAVRDERRLSGPMRASLRRHAFLRGQ